MERFNIRFDHEETTYLATIETDDPLSLYIVSAITPRCPGTFNREIPFDIVSNGLDYRTEADWDFMHALIGSLRVYLKDRGYPFV